MPKLSTSKPRIGSLKPVIGKGVQSEADRLRLRDQSVGWRGWYKTARWQKMRLRVLARDGYTCQATGLTLTGKYPAPNSPVVDHIRPHRGDAAMFWDERNLQAVSKAYHDGAKQSLEKGGRSKIWPPSNS